MRGRGRTVAIGAAIVGVVAVIAGAAVAGTRSADEAALRPARAAADRGVERKVDALLAKMTLKEKLQQLQLLSDGQITDEDARAGVGGVFSLTDPAKINHFQQVAVNGVAAPHPDPVRLRHDPRLPHDLPDPARGGEQLRPVRGGRRRDHRGARVGDRRPQADLQPDGRHLARAPLGPDRRGGGGGPLPRLGLRGRARQGRAGPGLLGAGQGRDQPEALRRLRTARGRP